MNRLATNSPLENTPAKARREYAWAGSFSISSLFHISFLVVCGSVWLAIPSEKPSPPLDARWVSVMDSREPQLVMQKPLETVLSERNFSGGNPALLVATELTPLAVPESGVPLVADVLTESRSSLIEDLQESISPVIPYGTGEPGVGSGNGPGDGDIQEAGFFGLATEGKRIVFVVDCSQSMNRPHNSPSKTRFRRLKLEMATTIAKMNEEQEFFIIFFNQNAVPMPAQGMQPATPTLKQVWLRWMEDVRATGDTDPRLALGLALSLQPDVIYFLTDGDFEIPIRRDLVKLRQATSVIHTYAFGDRSSEGTLKTLAARNGGKYYFIP